MHKNFNSVETTMLYMLESGSYDAISNFIPVGSGFTAVHAPNILLAKEVMRPRDAVTFDMTSLEDENDHRLYAATHALLLKPIWEILGDRAEIAFVTEGGFKWTGYRRISKLPKGFAVLGKPYAIYQVHFRFFDGNHFSYMKDVVAFGSSGAPLAIRCMLCPGNDHTNRSGDSAVLAASMIEDAYRPDVFVAGIHDAVTLRFPVAPSAHLDFFKLRDAPLTPSGRKKALLHWVRAHKRRGACETIPKHLRGAHEFSVDGLRATLEVTA